MSNLLKRTTYTSVEQKALLLQMMDKKPHLVSGLFNGSFTHKNAENEWQKITNTLNAIPAGATKDCKQWRKTWQDLRSKAKRKKAEQNRRILKTGGGEAGPVLLDNIDEGILSIVGTTETEGIDASESVVTIDISGYDCTSKPVKCSELSECIPVSLDSPGSLQTNITCSDSLQHIAKGKKMCERGSPRSSKAVLAATTSTPSQTSTPSTNKYVQRNKCKNVAVKRLENAIACSSSFQHIAERGAALKEEYFNKKLALYEREVRAREKSLALQERSTIAQEMVAKCIQNFVNKNESIIE